MLGIHYCPLATKGPACKAQFLPFADFSRADQLHTMTRLQECSAQKLPAQTICSHPRLAFVLHSQGHPHHHPSLGALGASPLYGMLLVPCHLWAFSTSCSQLFDLVPLPTPWLLVCIVNHCTPSAFISPSPSWSSWSSQSLQLEEVWPNKRLLWVVLALGKMNPRRELDLCHAPGKGEGGRKRQTHPPQG